MKNTASVAVRGARHHRGLTQGTLAEAASISKRAIEHWEAGTRYPSATSLVKLAGVLDVVFVCDKFGVFWREA